MPTTKLCIKGEVTGVCFRSFIREHAVRLNLKGWVKNAGDNQVQAIFEGPEQSINKMFQLCKKGPPLAKVQSIEEESLPVKHFKEFKVI
ncbi:MAG: acylphosphatase [Nanoarchaeota archaeon]|nr:acylphosphatase [Nanoarchaeota archaeon]